MSIARNTFYIAVGQSAPILVGLATVPVYLKTIGLERYGVLSICWLVLGYFGLFDLGLGRATAQRIAALTLRPARERSEVFWSALALNLSLSLAACAIFVPATAFIISFVKLNSSGLQGELHDTLPWLAAILPIALLSGVLSGALEGRQRFGVLSLIGGVGAVVMSILPLSVALIKGPSLRALVIATLAARALSLLWLFAACWRFVPLGRPTKPKRALLKDLAGYGGWITVSSIIGPLLSVWDRFAIGAVLGSAAIAVYVVPQNLVTYAQIVPSALSGALFPRFSSEAEVADQLSRDSLQFLSCLMTPLIVGAIAAIGPFLHLWVGNMVATAASPVAYILLVGIWANSLARVPLAKLQGMNRPHLVAKTHVAELIPYAVVLYLSMRIAGLPGVALAWTLRSTADAVILSALSDRTLTFLRPVLVPFALIVAAAIVALFLPLMSVPRWALHCLLLSIAMFLSYRRMPERMRQALASLSFKSVAA